MPHFGELYGQEGSGDSEPFRLVLLTTDGAILTTDDGTVLTAEVED